jgi:tetratricopeptide (TPR) repeat protein
MTPPKKSKSLQDILKQRSHSTFVGREEQIALFRQNMARSPELRDYFIFNVWGQGGVGKSTLLRQFRKLAEEAQCATALTSDGETSVPEALGRLADQLDQQGHKLNQFSERYKVYRQKKQELESDPDAPQGFSAFMGKAIAKASLGAAKQIPGSGVVTPFLDEDAISSQAGEWASYVAKKIGNKDEVRLVQEPVETLTPLFLQDLCKLAEQKNLLLIFDVYERTSPFLDSWFSELLEGRHGDLPANLLLAIAGRDELDKNRWADWEGAIARLPLNPFTEAEATQFLTRKGITNPQVITVILHLSGCLPLLVATLAAESPNDPAQIGDPSGTAVERFLQWVDDPKRRQLALDAALPRTLNRDVIAVLQGEDTADELFAWLRTMPFVEERSDVWAYHDIARTQMLRHKRRTSPQSWADRHGTLADYYGTLQTSLELDEKHQWKDDTWQTNSLHILYHRLCQAPQRQLPLALNQFLAALKETRKFAQQWAQTMLGAGKDTDCAEVLRWGDHFVAGLTAYDDDRYETTVELFTALLNHSSLTTQSQPIALSWRGETYRLMKRYQEALQDFDRAIELDPKYAWAISSRGITYRLMKRYEAALQDFDRAIELDPKYAWAIASRAETYRLMERYEEALQDSDKAIELNPKYDRAIAMCGVIYDSMQRYKEALQYFDRAIELNPQSVEAIALRGFTYRSMKNYEEALQNLNRAIELNPKYIEVISERGETYRLMKRYEAALQDFDRAIELDPKYAWAIASRGQTYRAMKRFEAALQDFDRAIELDSNSSWKISGRGETYRLMKRFEAALQAFNRAIELDPKDAWAIASRGQTYRAMERFEEALQDFNQAVELDPKLDWAIRERGEVLLALKRYQESLADFDQAIELDSNNDWRYYDRALAYQALNQPDRAKADLDRAIQLAQQQYDENPENHGNTFNLALYHLAAGTIPQAWHFYRNALDRGAPLSIIQEAIRDLEDFLGVLPGHEWAIKAKAELEKRLNR